VLLLWQIIEWVKRISDEAVGLNFTEVNDALFFILVDFIVEILGVLMICCVGLFPPPAVWISL
jgi:hypothetical protein